MFTSVKRIPNQAPAKPQFLAKNQILLTPSIPSDNLFWEWTPEGYIATGIEDEEPSQTIDHTNSEGYTEIEEF